MQHNPFTDESFLDIRPESGGLRLQITQLPGPKRPFVLVHGLSSNMLTWAAVARELAAAGHRVISVNQRGHGRSDKPDDGYNFATISEDLYRLLDLLELDAPILAGQSWGGNVMLDFASRYPGRARAFAFVDGGVLDLQSSPESDWERVSVDLRPPDLSGTPRLTLYGYLRESHPDWSEEGIEATLNNFETLPDGTVRAWLSLDRHMKILRALWDQRPAELYTLVQDPVLICMADEGAGSTWTVAKHRMVEAAQQLIPLAEVHWFRDSAHDIHVHRPTELASLFLKTLATGVWFTQGESR